MDVKDVSLLPSSELKVDYIKFDPDEQSSTSNDECNDKTMPVIADVMSIDPSTPKQCSKSKRTATVSYGPIKIRKRQTAAPTLATGRRSKDAVVEGDDAVKREIRRMKNRESARNLKKLRDNIERELETKVNQLESKEQELSTQITSLRTYKDYLEEHCKKLDLLHELIARTAAAALSAIERNRHQTSQSVYIRCDQTEYKPEPRSPSPQWQSLFTI